MRVLIVRAEFLTWALSGAASTQRRCHETGPRAVCSREYIVGQISQGQILTGLVDFHLRSKRMDDVQSHPDVPDSTALVCWGAWGTVFTLCGATREVFRTVRKYQLGYSTSVPPINCLRVTVICRSLSGATSPLPPFQKSIFLSSYITMPKRKACS